MYSGNSGTSGGGAGNFTVGTGGTGVWTGLGAGATGPAVAGAVGNAGIGIRHVALAGERNAPQIVDALHTPQLLRVGCVMLRKRDDRLVKIAAEQLALPLFGQATRTCPGTMAPGVHITLIGTITTFCTQDTHDFAIAQIHLWQWQALDCTAIYVSGGICS